LSDIIALLLLLLLLQGMTPQIVKGVLSQAILFMMKEEIMTVAVKILLVFYSTKRKQGT
jgi:hypothetical protein